MRPEADASITVGAGFTAKLAVKSSCPIVASTLVLPLTGEVNCIVGMAGAAQMAGAPELLPQPAKVQKANAHIAAVFIESPLRGRSDGHAVASTAVVRSTRHFPVTPAAAVPEPLPR
jgi:hypothetical protein